MGFKAKKKLYRLTWAEDTDLAGFEVIMSSIATGTLLELEEMSGRADEVAKDKASFRRLVDIFAGALIGWNLEDDFDQPIPATAEGVLTQDPDMIMAIIMQWTKAISGVTDPLGAGSTSGARSPEASVPMEPVSPNQAS